jgi:hypothetical protein
MSNLITFMETEDRNHKEKFMGDSLAKIFNLSTYCSSKVFEGISGRNAIGSVGASCIRDILTNFRCALSERGPHFQEAGFVSHDLPKIDYALNKFERYMKGDQTHLRQCDLLNN